MGDADEPRAHRPAVGLAPRALEVPVGLKERLLGQVLGVVVVAHPVVRVRVDVAQVRAVELRELAVELCLGESCAAGPLGVTCASVCAGMRHAALLARCARRSPAIHSSAVISPAMSDARPSRRGASIPARTTVSAISGTESSPSEAWPIRPGICSAGTPLPRSSPARRLRLPGARIVAVRSPTPARPAKVSIRAPARDAVVDALVPDAGGRDAGGVQAVRLGGGGGERGGVLGHAGHLDADDVVGPLADEAGAIEDLAELHAQVGVGRAEDERRHAGRRLARVRRAAEAGDRAGAHPLGDVVGRQQAHRLDQALREEQHRGARADLVGVGADRLRDRLRRHGEADQVAAGQLDVGGLLDLDALGDLHAGQVLLVLALALGDLGRLGVVAGAELDLEAAAGHQRGDGGAPAAGADHGGLAQRRQAAQVLPLKLDVRPDPLGDGLRRGSATGARSAGRSSALPARRRTLRGRMRQPRRTCSVPITATGMTGAPDSSARRPTPRFGRASEPWRMRVPSGKMTTVPPRSTASRGGLDGGLVRLAAADREGAKAAEDPALPALLEELDLGDELDRAAPRQERADHERVEEAPVVGGDDQAALEAGVLAALALEAEPDEEERAGRGSGRSCRRTGSSRARARSGGTRRSAPGR